MANDNAFFFDYDAKEKDSNYCGGKNKVLEKLNLSNETRTGFYFVFPYLALILFFLLLTLIFKDGWILIPVGIITIFPFLPIILGFIVLSCPSFWVSLY